MKDPTKGIGVGNEPQLIALQDGKFPSSQPFALLQ
jgi:hypothetical protein